MKRIALLGATGSIGASALDVIARHPDRFEVVALSAHNNVAALLDLCETFRPAVAVIADASCLDALALGLRERGLRDCEALAGAEVLDQVAADDRVDCVIAAIVGAAGLASTLAAAHAGKQILLANKEALVMSGPLLARALQESGGTLLPVDSEHNAIFQCLPDQHRQRRHEIRRLLLTASGGPFRGWDRQRLSQVTPDQACAHPNWVMGRKISVDSATLMNKGLEVIEAHWLFELPAERIDVVVHPQSLVHSLVEYIDGSMLAELGLPDMRTALAHALAWPERIDAGVGSLDLISASRLDFEPADEVLFRCLPLAYQALRCGGTAPTVLNAANEIAVEAFLAGSLPFLGIAELVDATLQGCAVQALDALDGVIAADLQARDAARAILARA